MTRAFVFTLSGFPKGRDLSLGGGGGLGGRIGLL